MRNPIPYYFLMLLLLTNTAWAKGMDELKPAEKTTEVVSSEEGEVKGEEPAKAEEKAPAAEAQQATATPTATPAPEPSATSKALSDKLSLRVGLGMGTIAASKGTWGTRGAADVGLGLRLFASASGRLAMTTTFRYAPSDVVVTSDSLSYRGVVEGYHLGILTRFGLSESLGILSSAEIGYMVVHLKQLDHVAGDPALKKAGMNFTLGGGAEWMLAQKVGIGPRFYVGFGRFRTVQFGAAASFVF